MCSCNGCLYFKWHTTVLQIPPDRRLSLKEYLNRRHPRDAVLFFSTCSLLSLWHSLLSVPEMELCVKNKLFCSFSTTNKQTSGTVQSTPLEHSIFLPKKWKWWQMGCRRGWERPDDGAVGAKHWLLKLSRVGGRFTPAASPPSSINLHLATVRHSFTQAWICC